VLTYRHRTKKGHRGSSEKTERRLMALKNARKSMLFDDLPSSERILKKDQRIHKTPRSGCGKTKLSREQAKDVVRKASYLRSYIEAHGLVAGNRRETRIYKCPTCGLGAWHTTSKKDRFQQSMSQEACIEAAA